MKNHSLVRFATVVLLSALSLQAFAEKKTPLTAEEAVAEQAIAQDEINAETAIIKSQNDILKNRSILLNSPLRKLSPAARAEFLDSLIFNSAGLASYSYKSLEALSVKEIYQVLSLFGAQQSVGIIPGLRPRDAHEKLIQSIAVGGGSDKPDNICADNGTGNGYKCSYSFGDVCRASCGKR